VITWLRGIDTGGHMGSIRISNFSKGCSRSCVWGWWSSVLPSGIEVMLGEATYVARNIAHNEKAKRISTLLLLRRQISTRYRFKTVFFWFY
jgi:hypothetical protein